MAIHSHLAIPMLHASPRSARFKKIPTNTVELQRLFYPKATFATPSRFLASTSPRCGSCARTLCVLRDTASCDFASQSSSRCSSGNLTPSVQVYPPQSFALRRMCPASSQRAGFRVLRGYKIPRQILTSQTILKYHTNHNFISLFSD